MKRSLFYLVVLLFNAIFLISWDLPKDELTKANIEALLSERMVYPCFFQMDYVDAPNALRERSCYTCKYVYMSEWNDWGTCDPRY